MLMPKIRGAVIVGGQLSKQTIVLHLAAAVGQSPSVTVQIPPPWDYSSCLEAWSSDSVDFGNSAFFLEDLMIGLVGSKITLVENNSTNTIVECGSIRIEKRFASGDNAVGIKVFQGDHSDVGR